MSTTSTRMLSGLYINSDQKCRLLLTTGGKVTTTPQFHFFAGRGEQRLSLEACRDLGFLQQPWRDD